MDPEFLMHSVGFLVQGLGWLGEEISKGDPGARAVVIALPFALAYAVARRRQEKEGKQFLRPDRNPPR